MSKKCLKIKMPANCDYNARPAWGKDKTLDCLVIKAVGNKKLQESEKGTEFTI